MNDYQAYKKKFDSDGFVIVRDFLTKDELGELRSQLERYIRDRVPTVPGTHAFYQDKARPETLKQMQFMEKVEPYFLEYCSHPKWNAAGRNPAGRTDRKPEPELVQQTAPH